MCRTPVTFGGGITIVYGWRSGLVALVACALAIGVALWCVSCLEPRVANWTCSECGMRRWTRTTLVLGIVPWTQSSDPRANGLSDFLGEHPNRPHTWKRLPAAMKCFSSRELDPVLRATDEEREWAVPLLRRLILNPRNEEEIVAGMIIAQYLDTANGPDWAFVRKIADPPKPPKSGGHPLANSKKALPTAPGGQK